MGKKNTRKLRQNRTPSLRAAYKHAAGEFTGGRGFAVPLCVRHGEFPAPNSRHFICGCLIPAEGD